MNSEKIVVALKPFGGLNPCDETALECALRLGREVVALSMVPLTEIGRLKALTRLGVKVICVSDKIYAGSDTLATSYVLSEAVKRIGAEIVFCGARSNDGDTAQVPPMLAERLGFRLTEGTCASDGRMECGEGKRTPSPKTVVAFSQGCPLRFPSVFSTVSEPTVWDNGVLNLSPERCGQNGSPTRVIKAYQGGTGKRKCSFVEISDLEALIARSREIKRVRAESVSAEKLGRLFYCGALGGLAATLAKEPVLFDTEGKSPQEIAEFLRAEEAKAVLWSDEPRLKRMAARVAVLLGAGLCADCTALRAERGRLVMTRPAREGNVTADIVCNGTAMATVRTASAECSDVVLSIGRGALASVDRIRALAERLGAELCCSRVVADGGFLPHSAQIGLTGRTVAPRVYVAFGISGAVQHTCAIEKAGTVIAVNRDRNARIFEYADYGIVTEI